MTIIVQYMGILTLDLVLKGICLASLTVTLYSLLGLLGMIALFIGAISAGLLSYRRWNFFRAKGAINNCSSRLKTLLLERSLLDIFRDLVYFPYITKIIGVFVSIAISKPHPQEIPGMLNKLPKEVSEVVNRKGLLSLAPQAVQKIILPAERGDPLPEDYGKTDENWYRAEDYRKIEVPIHEQTFPKKAIQYLDSKMGWPLAMVLLGGTAAGAHQMRLKRLRKMMVNNLTFCCLVLAVIVVAVKVRHRKRAKASKKE